MKERIKNLFARMGRGGVVAAIAALCLSCVALADDPVATASQQVTSSLTSGLTTSIAPTTPSA